MELVEIVRAVLVDGEGDVEEGGGYVGGWEG